MLSEIPALRFGEFTTQRVFFGQPGFLETMFGVGQGPDRARVPLPFSHGPRERDQIPKAILEIRELRLI
jgi:hypothetical protein